MEKTKLTSVRIQLLIFAFAVVAITFASVTALWFEWNGSFPSSSEERLQFINLWFGFILGPLGGIYLPISILGFRWVGGGVLLFPILGMALSWFPLRVFVKNKRNGPILLSISAIFWGFVPFLTVGLMSV